MAYKVVFARIPRAAVLLIAVLTLVGPSVAAAFGDDIVVTGGSLDARGVHGSGTLVLAGDRGFTFEGITRTGLFQPGECNAGPCFAGQRISLFAGWSGMDLTGVATLDGVTYPRVGDNFDTSSTHASLTVAFGGSVVLPQGSSAVTLVAPIVFDATFYHAGGPDLLAGSGTATIELFPITGYPEERWGVSRVSYQLGDRLAPPWASQDIGTVSTAGRTAAVGQSIVLAGNGTDIWGQADSFRFAYQELSGPGSIAARVIAQERVYPVPFDAPPALQPFAKSGVMMRASTAPGAASAILDVKPNGELEFMARYVADSPTIYVGGAQTSGENVSLMLTRKPDGEIEASYSDDGAMFTVLGSVRLSVPNGPLLAGLAVTSHEASVLNGAIFDHVVVSSAVPTNLLVRGDFEAYDPPALGPPGWMSDHFFRQVPAKSETHQPRSGAKNGACWTPEYLDCGIYQEVVAPAAGTYAFVVYASADRAGGLVGANVNGVTAASTDVAPRNFGEYARYEMTFTANAGDVIRVWMYSPATPGYVVIDDAALTTDR